MRVSEVRAAYAPDSAMGQVVDWIDNFLAAPHPDLGRKGSVCPFVPMSLDLDTIWMAEIDAAHPSEESISAVITAYRDLFLNTEPRAMPDAMNKAFMVVFSNLGQESAGLVDAVQYKLKKYFVDMGLMLGEFHAGNQSPGLRNADFFPLRSPIPMLAMRHMVDSDLPFLIRADYPAEERASFLRSYLARMAGELSPNKFSQALDGVIEAEIEKWIDKAVKGEAPAASSLLCQKCDEPLHSAEKHQHSELAVNEQN